MRRVLRFTMGFAEQRHKMVEEQLRGRGIGDARVLDAFEQTPREIFLDDAFHDQAYEDRAVMIGPQQSISQPFVVALMLEKLSVDAACKVLEIGTGTGYQTALLCKLSKQVYSVELDPDLSREAGKHLARAEVYNFALRAGDGMQGWREHAPYDRIIVSAAPDHIPRELVKQLAPGGKMILPVGTEEQVLVLLSKEASGLQAEEFGAVRFVAMRGAED